MSSIFTKLDVTHRAAAVARAREPGLGACAEAANGAAVVIGADRYAASSGADGSDGPGVLHPRIAGGAVIVQVFAEELHTRAGIDELVVSEHDILDGIALGLA